jgi:hypothetical protein
MNNNVVVKGNFPKSRRSLPDLNISTDKIKAAMPKASTVKSIFTWLWLAVRFPLFLVLYWLRLPITMVCNLVSAPALLAFLAGFFFISGDSPHRPIVWIFGGMSFAAFTLGWFYDSLLLVLAPEGVALGL